MKLIYKIADNVLYNFYEPLNSIYATAISKELFGEAAVRISRRVAGGQFGVSHNMISIYIDEILLTS